MNNKVRGGKNGLTPKKKYSVSDKQKQQIDDGIKLFKETWDGSCFLCGNRAEVIGIFQPDRTNENEEKYLMVKNKHSLFFYGLCKNCHNIKDKNEIIQNKISESILDY